MPEAIIPKSLNDEVKSRFWCKVKKSDGCWIWTAFKNQKGYGWFDFKGKNLRAHRVSWTIHNGAIPDGMLVLHECDNPSCVNPQHLFLGTNADNMRDRDNKGRQAIGARIGNAKLTDDDVLRIRELADNKTRQELADLFGVHNSQICRIIAGNRWRQMFQG